MATHDTANLIPHPIDYYSDSETPWEQNISKEKYPKILSPHYGIRSHLHNFYELQKRQHPTNQFSQQDSDSKHLVNHPTTLSSNANRKTINAKDNFEDLNSYKNSNLATTLSSNASKKSIARNNGYFTDEIMNKNYQSMQNTKFKFDTPPPSSGKTDKDGTNDFIIDFTWFQYMIIVLSLIFIAGICIIIYAFGVAQNHRVMYEPAPVISLEMQNNALQETTNKTDFDSALTRYIDSHAKRDGVDNMESETIRLAHNTIGIDKDAILYNRRLNLLRVVGIVGTLGASTMILAVILIYLYRYKGYETTPSDQNNDSNAKNGGKSSQENREFQDGLGKELWILSLLQRKRPRVKPKRNSIDENNANKNGNYKNFNGTKGKRTTKLDNMLSPMDSKNLTRGGSIGEIIDISNYSSYSSNVSTPSSSSTTTNSNTSLNEKHYYSDLDVNDVKGKSHQADIGKKMLMIHKTAKYSNDNTAHANIRGDGHLPNYDMASKRNLARFDSGMPTKSDIIHSPLSKRPDPTIHSANETEECSSSTSDTYLSSSETVSRNTSRLDPFTPSSPTKEINPYVENSSVKSEKTSEKAIINQKSKTPEQLKAQGDYK